MGLSPDGRPRLSAKSHAFAGRETTTLGSKIFYERIGDFCAVVVRDTRRGAFHFFHESVEIIARARNTHHPNRGAVPEFGGIQLRNRNIETGSQPVFQAADHLTPVFN